MSRNADRGSHWQKVRTVEPGVDYLAAYPQWLEVQNGALSGVNRFVKEPLYLRNGRDLGEYVHRDFAYQPYLAACLILLKWSVPVDGGNPYNTHGPRRASPPSARRPS